MKKLLCGILAIMLVFSIFAACSETENPTNPTTTTTTQQTTPNDPKLEELRSYIGYWYVSESAMIINKDDANKYADVQMIYVSDVWEKDGKILISLETYLPKAYSLKNTPLAREYYPFIQIDTETNTFTGEYDFELKNGTIVVDGGKIVFNHKTSDDAFYNEIMDYNEQVIINRYEGYWYMYGVQGDDTTPPAGELHIKAVDGWYITFDYTWGDYHGENITADIKRGIGRFELGDGGTGVLDFECWSGDYVIRLGIFENDEKIIYVGFFGDKSPVRLTGEEENLSLNGYKGYWYTDDVTEDWKNDPGIGYNEICVEKINGNKMTLLYNFAGVTGDKITVEINNNVGVFDTVYMGENGGKGVIRIKDDGIYIELRKSADDEPELNGNFIYQRTYSLRTNG